MPVTQITTKDAFETLNNDENSILIDVRAIEETNFVGVVDPNEVGDRAAIIPWKLFPNMKINSDFSENLTTLLKAAFKEKSKSAKVIFLCRTGGRSDQAATMMSAIGYDCYNIEHGFEGDLDDDGHRGNINGWKADNLPWRQS